MRLGEIALIGPVDPPASRANQLRRRGEVQATSPNSKRSPSRRGQPHHQSPTRAGTSFGVGRRLSGAKSGGNAPDTIRNLLSRLFYRACGIPGDGSAVLLRAV